MDDSAIILSPALALIAFLGVIVLLLILIARWRWHVFLALLVPLLLFGASFMSHLRAFAVTRKYRRQVLCTGRS